MSDIRDGETYNIRKLADGKCWMTQNLRLARTKAVILTSVDSDVSSNFSLPKAPTTITSWGDYNTASDVNTIHLYNSGDISYAVYYNWYAATAGTGTYGLTSGTAKSSICPKNWRLPTGYDGDYYVLYVAEGMDYTNFMQHGGWILSGIYHYSGTIHYRDHSGVFASSTPTSEAYRAYYLSIGPSRVYPVYNDYGKANGFSVRCVTR